MGITTVRREHSLKSTAEILFLLGAVLLVLVPASPLFQHLTSGDSGIFLYVGWLVTDGAIPYRDAWDSKPPLIFAIDALGLFLGNGSRWGVWAIEVVSLFSAAAIAFVLVKRAFGKWPAIYATFAWLLNAFLAMDGGNYTTEYALPLQFACLWLIGTAPKDSLSTRRAFAIGLLGSLLFWLKPNLIGIPTAIGLYLIMGLIASSRKGMQLQALIAMVAGGVLISLLVLAPFAANSALGQLWDAAFRYNFDYIQTTWMKRLLVLRDIPLLIPAASLALFALIGWLLTGVAAFKRARRSKEMNPPRRQVLFALPGDPAQTDQACLSQGQVDVLLLVGLIALPLELLLVSLSGYPFDHYFLALLPISTIFAALTFRTILWALAYMKISRPVTALLLLSFLGVTGVLATENVRRILGRVTGRDKPAVIDYIVENTRLTDRVLIWGGEARVLFAARRASPSRFFTFLPLQRASADPKRVQEFLEETLQHPPRLILDPHAGTPFLQFPATSPAIEELESRLRATYRRRTEVNGWTVYERFNE